MVIFNHCRIFIFQNLISTLLFLTYYSVFSAYRVELYKIGIEHRWTTLQRCVRNVYCLLQVFKPPNPWTMSVIYILAEIHHEQDLKLNLKFEIEVLCKNLQLDMKVSDPVFVHLIINKTITSWQLIDNPLCYNI